jgi:DNA invertase Pin-like site-specific DNA recombinase
MVMDRVEVITSVKRRRRWSAAEKARLQPSRRSPARCRSAPSASRPSLDSQGRAAGLYAALAEKERTLISARTTAALAAARERAATLGNPRLAEVRGKGLESLKAEAERFAANVLPIIQPLKAQGLSLRKIAEELNARRIPTARGGTWAATQVADILRRRR